MTVTSIVSKLKGDTRIRIESEYDKDQTGRAWAYDGTAEELLTAETPAAYEGRRYGSYQVRNLRYYEPKECFILSVD